MGTQPRHIFTVWGFWIILALYVLYLLIGPFHLLGHLSLFPHTLPANPIVWWPVVSLYSVVALSLYAVVFLGLVRFTRLTRSNAWMRGHVILAAVMITSALAMDVTGGTAVYTDRIVTREPDRLNPLYQNFDLAKASEIQVSCSQSANTFEIGYVIQFQDRQTVNLTTGLAPRPQAREWYAALQGLQHKLEGRGIKRFISEWHSDNSYMDCMAGYMEQLDPARRAAITELFLPARKTS
ncbi:hypothetical protein ABAC460_04670 [Asticcacaulis sp. AC460]|uniref:hypothetical protein n=1 Tax=Asticcacaulis sp. AC460 TaxID=1282360 RepID=UPI0003C3FF82|nr:hypothetical protein [Asticcacaulis sp. AC460]ESQ92186.1 hypothetical protein ABAC460_04670 [Asticcacaulis sp. AC460]